MPELRTEFPFVLPKGWIDPNGTLHRKGRMRLATARDELEALTAWDIQGPDDPRIAAVVLSRVIVALGALDGVTPEEVADFFAADVAHLQDLYSAINYGTEDEIKQVIAPSDDDPAPLRLVGSSPEPSVAPATADPAMDKLAARHPSQTSDATQSPTFSNEADGQWADEPAFVDGEAVLEEPSGDVDLDVEPSADPAVELAKRRPRGRRAHVEEIGRSGGAGR